MILRRGSRRRIDGVEQAVRCQPPPIGGQRHHPMRQGERRQAVANPGLGLVGQLDLTAVDVDAAQLEAEQHRRRVLHVDVEVRDSLHER